MRAGRFGNSCRNCAALVPAYLFSATEFLNGVTRYGGGSHAAFQASRFGELDGIKKAHPSTRAKPALRLTSASSQIKIKIRIRIKNMVKVNGYLIISPGTLPPHES